MNNMEKQNPDLTKRDEIYIGHVVDDFRKYLNRIGINCSYDTYQLSLRPDIGLKSRITRNFRTLKFQPPFDREAISLVIQESDSIEFKTGRILHNGDYKTTGTVYSLSPKSANFNEAHVSEILTQIALHIMTQKHNVDRIFNTADGKPSLTLRQPAYDPHGLFEKFKEDIKAMTGLDLPVTLPQAEPPTQPTKKGWFSRLFGGQSAAVPPAPALLAPPAQDTPKQKSHADIAAEFKKAVSAIQFQDDATSQLAQQVGIIAEQATQIIAQGRGGNPYLSSISKRDLIRTINELDMITPVIGHVKPEDQLRALTTLSARFHMALEELGRARIEAATEELDIILSLRNPENI